MKKEHLEILAKIIGGVESGGQIYGGQNYAAYAGKAANSSNEKTCTLGWAQNYGNEGRRLCKMILAADAAAVRQRFTEKPAVRSVQKGRHGRNREEAVR